MTRKIRVNGRSDPGAKGGPAQGHNGKGRGGLRLSWNSRVRIEGPKEMM